MTFIEIALIFEGCKSMAFPDAVLAINRFVAKGSAPWKHWSRKAISQTSCSFLRFTARGDRHPLPVSEMETRNS